MINKGTVVLHSCVDLQRVVPAPYSEMCVTSFQDVSEVMAIKVEEVTEVKEEQEDPLTITCPALDVEQEVSCVSVCTLLHTFPRQICLADCTCVVTLNGCLLVNGV
jgi:hypothetical protein